MNVAEQFESEVFGSVVVTESEDGLLIEFDRPAEGYDYSIENPDAEETGQAFIRPETLPDRMTAVAKDVYEVTAEEIDTIINAQMVLDNIIGYRVLEIL